MNFSGKCTSAELMPQLAIIVAMTRDRVIGSQGGLPWQLPEELTLFKRLTTGCTVIMGQKTYAAIGKPLPERYNIVLSRSPDRLPGVHVCGSFMTGLAVARRQGRPVFVIGGAELFRKALPIATDLHISWVKGNYAGDVHFPELDLADWCCCAEEEFPGFHYMCYRRSRITVSGNGARGRG